MVKLPWMHHAPSSYQRKETFDSSSECYNHLLLHPISLSTVKPFFTAKLYNFPLRSSRKKSFSHQNFSPTLFEQTFFHLSPSNEKFQHAEYLNVIISSVCMDSCELWNLEAFSLNLILEKIWDPENKRNMSTPPAACSNVQYLHSLRMHVV